jgi:hypothetical protein
VIRFLTVGRVNNVRYLRNRLTTLESKLPKKARTWDTNINQFAVRPTDRFTTDLLLALLTEIESREEILSRFRIQIVLEMLIGTTAVGVKPPRPKRILQDGRLK